MPVASVAFDQLCTMDIKAYKVEDLGIPRYLFGSIIYPYNLTFSGKCNEKYDWCNC